MNPLISLFLAAGVTTFAYTKLNQRTGYGNTASIVPTLVVIFFATLIVAYTLFQFVLHLS
jgi:hypothetical protein